MAGLGSSSSPCRAGGLARARTHPRRTSARLYRHRPVADGLDLEQVGCDPPQFKERRIRDARGEAHQAQDRADDIADRHGMRVRVRACVCVCVRVRVRACVWVDRCALRARGTKKKFASVRPREHLICCLLRQHPRLATWIPTS